MGLGQAIRRTIKGKFVCFRHAVLAARFGEEVEEEITTDIYYGDMRPWSCEACIKEHVEKER